MPASKERLIPQSLIRDLIVGNGLLNKPAVLQTLKIKFDYNHSNPPAYLSIETYMALLEYLRQTLFGDKPEAEGYSLMGVASLEGHFQGSVGKINKIAARMFSIEKSAELYLKTQNYNYPFGTHKMEEVRKGYLRYHRINVPAPPAFTQGVIGYLVELTGGKNVKTTVRILGPEEMIYEATWD